MTRRKRSPFEAPAPGVQVIRQRDGSASYRARRWLRGKAVYGPLRDELAEAVADSRTMQLKREEMPDKVLTFSTAVEEARAAMVTRGVRYGSLAWFDNHKKTPLAFFGDQPLHRIGHQQLGEYIRHRRETSDGLTNNALQHDRRFLSLVFNEAQDAGRLHTDQVRRYLRKQWPRPTKSVATYMLPDELAEVIKSIRKSKGESRDIDAAVIVFLAGTGLRLSEAARLHVGDINLKRKMLRVAMAKRQPREIPLRPELVPAVKRILDGRDKFAPRQDDYLFAPFTNDGIEKSDKGKPAIEVAHERRTETINRVLWRWSEILGEKRLHAHALRHSCGVGLALAGWSPYQIKAYLGHQGLDMVSLYTNLAPALQGTSFENVKLPV